MCLSTHKQMTQSPVRIYVKKKYDTNHLHTNEMENTKFWRKKYNEQKHKVNSCCETFVESYVCTWIVFFSSLSLSSIFIPVQGWLCLVNWFCSLMSQSEYNNCEFVVFVFLISLDTSTLICVVQFCQTGWLCHFQLTWTKTRKKITRTPRNRFQKPKLQRVWGMKWDENGQINSKVSPEPSDYIIRRQSSVLVVLRC